MENIAIISGSLDIVLLYSLFLQGYVFFVYFNFEHIAIKDVNATVGLDLFINMQWSKWQLPQLAWYAGYGEQQCVILSAKLAYNILHYFFFRQQLVFSLSPFDLGFDFFVPYQYFFAKILCWCKLKTILISFSCWNNKYQNIKTT